MRIGITYDLRHDYLAAGFGEEETAEFDSEDTIDAIDDTLYDMGFETDRVGNIKDLTSRLVNGERWDMVFNIAEGLSGFGREAQVPAVLDAYNIPYTFSDPLVLALTLHKGMAKHVIRDVGIPTPDFFVVESESDVDMIALPFPLFAKPVGEGTSKGIDVTSMLETEEAVVSVCHRLLRTFNQPVIVETFLPGREFTVGIVGTGEHARTIGVIEVFLKEKAEPHAHSYWNKQRCEEMVEYKLVDDSVARHAGEIAQAAWLALGCRDAGRIDIRVDRNGVPNFMEANPLAGLNPDRSDLCIIARQAGMAYRSLIEAIMLSALERYASKPLNWRVQAFADLVVSRLATCAKLPFR